MGIILLCAGGSILAFIAAHLLRSRKLNDGTEPAKTEPVPRGKRVAGFVLGGGVLVIAILVALQGLEILNLGVLFEAEEDRSSAARRRADWEKANQERLTTYARPRELDVIESGPLQGFPRGLDEWCPGKPCVLEADLDGDSQLDRVLGVQKIGGERIREAELEGRIVKLIDREKTFGIGVAYADGRRVVLDKPQTGIDFELVSGWRLVVAADKNPEVELQLREGAPVRLPLR